MSICLGRDIGTTYIFEFPRSHFASFHFAHVRNKTGRKVHPVVSWTRWPPTTLAFTSTPTTCLTALKHLSSIPPGTTNGRTGRCPHVEYMRVTSIQLPSDTRILWHLSSMFYPSSLFNTNRSSLRKRCLNLFSTCPSTNSWLQRHLTHRPPSSPFPVFACVSEFSSHSPMRMPMVRPRNGRVPHVYSHRTSNDNDSASPLAMLDFIRESFFGSVNLYSTSSPLGGTSETTFEVW